MPPPSSCLLLTAAVIVVRSTPRRRNGAVIRGGGSSFGAMQQRSPASRSSTLRPIAFLFPQINRDDNLAFGFRAAARAFVGDHFRARCKKNDERLVVFSSTISDLQSRQMTLPDRKVSEIYAGIHDWNKTAQDVACSPKWSVFWRELGGQCHGLPYPPHSQRCRCSSVPTSVGPILLRRASL
jgi:hypothetical protein